MTSNLLVTSSVSTATLEVVIPVYNEEADLEQCIRRLHAHLEDTIPFSSQITIADNASTDGTLAVADKLAKEIDGVRVHHLDEKGRGRALKAVWIESTADVVAYMDVDLSTDLNALMPLIAPLLSGHSDLAIGSRLNRSSRVVRGAKREFISRSYNLILRASLRARFSDAQCGFKAMRTEVARELLPLVQDTGWFFDTELLVIAERAGLRIHEVPVDWVDDPDSSVDVIDTAVKDLKGCWRVGRALASGALPVAELRRSLGREPLVAGVPHGMVGQMVRFGIVGVASTIAYALLYLVLHPIVGGAGRELPRPTDHGRSEHRREPGLHLRRPWTRRRGQATRCRVCSFSGSRCSSPAGRSRCCTHGRPGRPGSSSFPYSSSRISLRRVCRFLALRWVFRNNKGVQK